MKKILFTLLFAFLCCGFLFAQQKKSPANNQFTKSQLLAFKNIKELLAIVDKSKDYSKYLVRNFNLTTTLVNPDKSIIKLSEMGPGGTWSDKQKNIIQRYAKKGTTFILEKIVLIESGKKGAVPQSDISFVIK